MINSSLPGVLITSAGRRVELVHIWKQSLMSTLGSEAYVYTTDLDPLIRSMPNLR